MALYALKELQAAGISPSRLSFANLLRAFRRMSREYLHPVQKGATFCDLLYEAVIDNDARGLNTSCGYPRKKRRKPPGAPHIVNATLLQRSRAKETKTPVK